MQQKTHKKLFVCLLKNRAGDAFYEDLKKGLKESGEHARYMTDLWQRGIFWAGGPTADPKTSIEIYSVDSVEEAIEAQRHAPLYVKGYLYEDKYLEWHPAHWPPPTLDINPSSGKKLRGDQGAPS
jgi:uncharacterized protein YciI